MSTKRSVSNVQQVQKIPHRPGEGAVIGAIRQALAGPNGQTSLTLVLDLESAQVPDRRYVANAVDITYEGDRVTFVFGQHKLGKKGYRSLLILEMSSTYARQFINASKEMGASVAKYLEQFAVQKVEIVKITEDVPGQTVTMGANIAAAGFTGRDACMDFYYASPFAVQIASRGGEFSAEPVVRVNMTTALMFAIYKKLESWEDSFPREIKEEQE